MTSESTIKCNRKSVDEKNCITYTCFDIQSMKNSEKIECPEIIWEQHYDENAKANYWYNDKTNEATWVKPDDFIEENKKENKTSGIIGGKNKFKYNKKSCKSHKSRKLRSSKNKNKSRKRKV